MEEPLLDRKITKYQLEEKFEEATKLQRERLERAKEKYEADSPELAVNMYRLGSILEATSSSSNEEIEDLYRKALNIYIKCRKKKTEFEFATAEILSSLAKIVSRDPKRREEADAIHRSSLNVYSNWFDAKNSEAPQNGIVRALVALDVDAEDNNKKQTESEDDNLSWESYNRRGSNPTKKFTSTL